MAGNCDQIVDFDCLDFIQDSTKRGLDGSVLFSRKVDRNLKWPYVRTDSTGIHIAVREKVAISDLATMDIYFFAKGAYFIDATFDMSANNNERVNNDFYTCTLYNYMITQGKKVGIYEVPKIFDAWHRGT